MGASYSTTSGPFNKPVGGGCGGVGGGDWQGFERDAQYPKLWSVYPNGDWCITGFRLIVFTANGTAGCSTHASSQVRGIAQVRIASIGQVMDGQGASGIWYRLTNDRVGGGHNVPSGFRELAPWSDPGRSDSGWPGAGGPTSCQFLAPRGDMALSKITQVFGRNVLWQMDFTWLSLENGSTLCTSTAGTCPGSNALPESRCTGSVVLGDDDGIIQRFKLRYSQGHVDLFTESSNFLFRRFLRDAFTQVRDPASGDNKPRLLNDPIFRRTANWAKYTYNSGSGTTYYRDKLGERYCQNALVNGKLPIECWCLDPDAAPINDTRSSVGIDRKLAQGLARQGYQSNALPTCWSSDCKIRGRDATINPTYLTTYDMDTVVCPVQPINVCAVNVNVWQSEGVELNFPNVTQECQFSTTNPPPGCLEDPTNPLCQEYILDRANGQPCTESKQCSSKRCVAQVCAGSLREIGQSCTGGSDCKSGRCQNEVCLGKNDGSTCTGDDECSSGACNNKLCGVPAQEPNGSECKNNSDCDSGSCQDGECVASTLKPVGALCITPSECRSGNCTSGICRAPVRKADGQACITGSECRSASCTQGKCGIPGPAPDATPSFWDNYKWYIIGAGAALVIMVIAIVWFRSRGNNARNARNAQEADAV